MKSIDAEEVRKCLTMPVAIDAMDEAFRALSGKKADMPARTHLDLPRHSGTTLVMPAYVDSDGVETLSVKVATVFSENPSKGLPTVLATVLVFDPENGSLLAMIDGAELTAIRTAAASAAATRALAREDSHRLGLIGVGVQARTHLAAIAAVRPIDQVRVAARSSARCDEYIEWAKKNFSGVQFEKSEINSLVSDSDIVCTLTHSSEPLFEDSRVQPGCHLNVVGSHQPHAAEVPGKLVARAAVYVDHWETALREAGDLIQPIEQGLMKADQIVGEMGSLLLGECSGRRDSDQVTLFKSVGNAVEDAVAAHQVLKQLGLLPVSSTTDRLQG